MEINVVSNIGNRNEVGVIQFSVMLEEVKKVR